MLLCAGVVSALPGCLDTAPLPDVDGPGLTGRPSPAPEQLGQGTAVIGEYVLHVSPRQRTAKLGRLERKGSARPGLTTQSVDDLDLDQDSDAGSGAVNTVELNTTSVDYGAACPSGIASSFCAHVELGNFYARSLNNVFVQVTDIKDGPLEDPASQTITGHGSINSDGQPFFLPDDPGFGLWKHTGLGVTTAGVVGTTFTSKIAPRDWEFADPDGADTYIYLRVLASLSYSDYGWNVSTQAPINACSLSTSTLTKPLAGSAVATIPFPFTFYSAQATTTARFTRDGVVTFGTAVPPSAANTPFVNVNLPEEPVSVSVSPGLFVFWDQLNYNTVPITAPKSSIPGICYGEIGAAPNRQFVITWNNMRGFNDLTNTMNLTFSAILSEGSDTIDLVYGSMLSGKGTDPNVYPPDVDMTTSYKARAAGKKAVVGVQGADGVATPFPALRGGTDTSTGKGYRFTPQP
ncbi:MAG: hypothetical protein ACMG6S_02125 [Byssovorax sp.]